MPGSLSQLWNGTTEQGETQLAFCPLPFARSSCGLKERERERLTLFILSHVVLMFGTPSSHCL